MKREDLRVYAVTDRRWARGRGLPEMVAQAVRGGATCVQLREKECSSREFYEMALELRKLLTRLNVPFIINDRIDIALAVKADGVHLGRTDMPVEAARRIMGSKAIIGVTASTALEVGAARLAGADYIGLGAIYPSETKKDHSPVIGLEGLRLIRNANSLPIVATSGINARNAADVIAAGADGVAVVSAIFGASNIEQAAREVASAVNVGLQKRR